MIDKVGGVILIENKILVQRKKNNREECIIPGGKRKEGESDFETLKRELWIVNTFLYNFYKDTFKF